MPCLSENKYELAGEYWQRKEKQKEDENGNKLYLSNTEILDEEGNGTGVFSETTASCFVNTIYDDEGNVVREDTTVFTPIIIDDGAMYEWKELIKSLSEMKQDKINEIKSMRDSEEAATPIECSGFLFDFYPKARERLSEAFDGATLAVLNGSPLSTVIANWKLYDNTSKDMTIADFFALKQAIITRSQQLHNKANVLKEFINAAESEEELNQIKW